MKNKKFLSWKKYGEYVSNLISDIELSGIKFDTIVGVAKSGVIPAYTVGQMLGIPIETIHYSSKVGRGSGQHPNIVPDSLLDTTKKILIVDDLTDSGNTIKELREKIPHAKIAVLIHKDTCPVEPDFFGGILTKDECSKWIYFPWDSFNCFETGESK